MGFDFPGTCHRDRGSMLLKKIKIPTEKSFNLSGTSRLEVPQFVLKETQHFK